MAIVKRLQIRLSPHGGGGGGSGRGDKYSRLTGKEKKIAEAAERKFGASGGRQEEHQTLRQRDPAAWRERKKASRGTFIMGEDGNPKGIIGDVAYTDVLRRNMNSINMSVNTHHRIVSLLQYGHLTTEEAERISSPNHNKFELGEDFGRVFKNKMSLEDLLKEKYCR